jgi:Tfp pilus assembly protein FimT
MEAAETFMVEMVALYKFDASPAGARAIESSYTFKSVLVVARSGDRATTTGVVVTPDSKVGKAPGRVSRTFDRFLFVADVNGNGKADVSEAALCVIAPTSKNNLRVVEELPAKTRPADRGKLVVGRVGDLTAGSSTTESGCAPLG